MPQHILVTGGAGYVGGATVRLLLENSFRVTVLDDLSRGHRATVPSDARLVVGSVDDFSLLSLLFEEDSFDAVMHFAAFAEVGESMLQPALYFRNNTAAPGVPTDAWFVHSHDGGATWAEQHVAGPFDIETAPVARGYFLGDYEGLATSGNDFLAFFVMTNSGNFANRTDVFSVRLSR